MRATNSCDPSSAGNSTPQRSAFGSTHSTLYICPTLCEPPVCEPTLRITRVTALRCASASSVRRSVTSCPAARCRFSTITPPCRLINIVRAASTNSCPSASRPEASSSKVKQTRSLRRTVAVGVAEVVELASIEFPPKRIQRGPEAQRSTMANRCRFSSLKCSCKVPFRFP